MTNPCLINVMFKFFIMTNNSSTTGSLVHVNQMFLKCLASIIISFDTIVPLIYHTFLNIQITHLNQLSCEHIILLFIHRPSRGLHTSQFKPFQYGDNGDVRSSSGFYLYGFTHCDFG